MRIVFIILSVFVFQACAQAENWARQQEIKKLPAEYQVLGEACLTKASFNCCMVSVRRMANGKYVQTAMNNGTYQCPDGYVRNMLKCVDSYAWCEPKKEVQQ